MKSPQDIARLVNQSSLYLAQLAALNQEMDDRYEAVAAQYGFVCRGCQDNCCQTRFYHHTHIEFFSLAEGFRQLPAKEQHAAIKRADRYNRLTETDPGEGAHREMCPINVDGLCLLYSNRPLICRLHGLPHELRRPGADPTYSPGCGALYDQVGRNRYIPFDRTPVYIKMAQLEKACKDALNLTGKCRLTVAQMLLAIAGVAAGESDRGPS